MDGICNEIYEIINQKNYRQLFNYDAQSIQIFFDEVCMEGTKIHYLTLLLQLFPNISITNAIIYSYINNNKPLFELLCSYIDAEFKAQNKDFLIVLLTQSSHQHNGDRTKYILPEFLQILVNKQMFGCNELLISATDMNEYRLAKLSFVNSSKEAKLQAFRIAYNKGYHDIAEMIYCYIRNERIFVDKNLGYCPSGSIIEMVNYQEFYDWKDQFNESVKERNYYALECLLNKMPYKISIPFTMLEPLLSTCPDSLLYLILQKFVVKNIDFVDISKYNRRPLRDYVRELNAISGWEIMKEEKIDFFATN